MITNHVREFCYSFDYKQLLDEVEYDVMRKPSSITVLIHLFTTWSFSLSLEKFKNNHINEDLETRQTLINDNIDMIKATSTGYIGLSCQLNTLLYLD